MSAGAATIPRSRRPAARLKPVHLKVYPRAITRTNIDIDDELVGRAMRLYRLRSKREAVDLALRQLVGEPMGREEALASEGSGWAGDLAEIRARDEVFEG